MGSMGPWRSGSQTPMTSRSWRPARWHPQQRPTSNVAESQPAVDVLSGRAGGGGTARAAPGIRTEYSPGYYAAFVNDPDGNNVEAVHHG
jgi:hypothetical protein